jgi:hypothetical protein
LQSLESLGIRLAVALLLGLGVVVGSVVLLYFPVDRVIWIPVTGLAVALGAALVSWRPFGYLVVGWSALLVAGCVILLMEFARADAPIGVLLVLLVAGCCLAGGGLLELAALRHQPSVGTRDNSPTLSEDAK